MDPLITHTPAATIGARVSSYLNHERQEYQKKRKMLAFFALFGLYLLGAFISHEVYDLSSPALIWPSAGLALSILFLEGIDLWPAIFLATLVAYAAQGLPWFMVLGLAVTNSIENIVGAAILRRSRFSPLLTNLRDVILLIFVSIGISILTPTLGSLLLLLSGTSAAAVQVIWVPWWLGKMLSHLVMGALIMRWLVRWPLKRTRRQLFFWATSFLMLLASCYVVFWTPFTHVGPVALVYIVLVPLIWMALSIGPRGVTLALFSMTLLSIGGVLYGYHPTPALMPVSSRLIQIEVFDAILTIIFLIFVSSEEGRKLASRALQEHIVRLEAAVQRISSEDRAKNEFLAILAHELRNPLAPILSSLELMRLPRKDPHEEERLLDTMDGRVRTMARLLDDLLDISRISQKKFKLQKETVDLNAIVKRSVETAAGLMQSKNHTLKVQLFEHPTWVSGDPVRLEQIVINLLNNAAKYTEPGGTITLHAERDTSWISICVKDTGVGIPHEMLKTIFEPFLQVEQKQQSEGLGIGLALARRLAEMHDGSIEAKSDGLGLGSEFIVRFPAPATELAAPALSPDKKQVRAERQLHILIVDDNKLAADGLGKLLAHKGHTVSLAYDASEALAVAPKQKPDVIVLDIGLPDMDGYSVVRHLKEGGMRSFFIALTGYGQENDKEKARKAGFDHHLTKPVSIVEVEAVLATVPVPEAK